MFEVRQRWYVCVTNNQFVWLNYFGSLWFFGLISGISVLQLTRFTVLLVASCAFGYWFLRVLQFDLASQYLRFGLAMVLGFIAVALLMIFRGESELFRSIPFAVLVVLLGLISGIPVPKQTRSQFPNHDVNKDERTFLSGWLLAATALILSQGWTWAVTTIPAFATLQALTWWRSRRRITAFLKGASLSLVLLYVTVGTTRLQAHQWWGYRASGMPDPDVQFAESSVNSIIAFGLSNNIFFDGVENRYHFLSFAWLAGVFSAIGEVPFAASAILGPVTIALTFVTLLLGLFLAAGRTVRSAMVRCTLVTTLWVSSIPLVGFWLPYSTSHNFSILILVAAAAVLMHGLRSGQLVLFGIYASAATLSKASLVGPVGLISALATIHYGVVVRRAKRAVGFALAASAVVAIFVWHYRPVSAAESSETFRPYFAVGELLGQKGFGPPSDGLVGQIISTTVFLALCLVVVHAGKSHPRHAIVRLHPTAIPTIAGSASIVAGCLYVDAAESSHYLVAAGFALVLVPVQLLAEPMRELRTKPNWRLFGGALLIGMVVALCRTIFNTDSNFFLYSIAAVTVVCVVAIRRERRAERSQDSAGLSMAAIAIFLPVVAVNAISNLEQLRQSREVEWNGFELPAGDKDLQELFEWVRNNTPEKSVMLSSRQCNFGYQRFNTDLPQLFNFGAPCSQIYSLTSALTGRAQYFEGHYPLLPPVTAEERTRRYSLADTFFSSPTIQSAEGLRLDGVDFVVVESITTGISEVSRLGGIVFRNQAGYVIDLQEIVGA